MWPLFLTLCLAGSLHACLSQAPRSGERTKLVSLEMKRQQSGVAQAGSVSLHFNKDSVDCSLNFKLQEIRSYIASLGAAAIPAVFRVSYDDQGKPSGALLVRVGKWDASKLTPNEKLLSTTQKFERSQPGERKTVSINSPGTCFDSTAPTP